MVLAIFQLVPKMSMHLHSDKQVILLMVIHPLDGIGIFACANTSVNTDGFHVFLFNLMLYLYRYSPVKKRSIFFTE